MKILSLNEKNLPFQFKKIDFCIGTFLILGVMAVFSSCKQNAETEQNTELKLWYKQPATMWEEALPIGNGRLGAMVYGNPTDEIIQFNEDTFWAGAPNEGGDTSAWTYLAEARRLVFEEKYEQAHDFINEHLIGPPMMPYLPMGRLRIKMDHHEDLKDYRRELNLNTAIAKISYTCGEVQFSREVFSSPIDQAIIIRMESNEKDGLNFDLAFDKKIGANSWVEETSILVLAGKAPDKKGRKSEITFEARLKVLTENGYTEANDTSIAVRNATNATLILVAATNFKNYKSLSADPQQICINTLSDMKPKNYVALRRSHITEHQRIFSRLNLELEASGSSHLPTDQRLVAFQNAPDPALVALYYQFGRYLLLSSSRPGSQPANLQGLWNANPDPPWDSRYTININLEMNYWPAEASNLAECTMPLFTLIRDLSETGQFTAKNYWGVNGWVCHHNTDIWRSTTPLDGATWGIWPTGGAWLCSHIWKQYEYSGSTSFLRLYYPVMKESARFFVESLVTDPSSGYLLTCPSVSPENRHMEGNISVCAGPAADIQIIRDLFNNCISAAKELNLDIGFSDTLASILAKLPPDQIGEAGQLQEWMDDWDMKVPEPSHRHVSHLYGLFPGEQFNEESSPELWNAARRSLELRGDGGTGWSLAWKINLWARLNDGEHAYTILKKLLKPTSYTGHGGPGGTYPNLFDACPPFEIDGNFGAVSGINEMILQSRNGKIILLPAIPKALNTGRIKGLIAKGGFEFTIEWDEGKLIEMEILSMRGNPLKLIYGDKAIDQITESGMKYRFNEFLNIVE